MDEIEGVCPKTSEVEELVLMGIGGTCSGCGVMFIPEADVDTVEACIEQFDKHVVEREGSGTDSR